MSKTGAESPSPSDPSPDGPGDEFLDAVREIRSWGRVDKVIDAYVYEEKFKDFGSPVVGKTEPEAPWLDPRSGVEGAGDFGSTMSWGPGVGEWTITVGGGADGKDSYTLDDLEKLRARRWMMPEPALPKEVQFPRAYTHIPGDVMSTTARERWKKVSETSRRAKEASDREQIRQVWDEAHVMNAARCKQVASDCDDAWCEQHGNFRWVGPDESPPVGGSALVEPFVDAFDKGGVLSPSTWMTAKTEEMILPPGDLAKRMVTITEALKKMTDACGVTPVWTSYSLPELPEPEPAPAPPQTVKQRALPRPSHERPLWAHDMRRRANRR